MIDRFKLTAYLLVVGMIANADSKRMVRVILIVISWLYPKRWSPFGLFTPGCKVNVYIDIPH